MQALDLLALCQTVNVSVLWILNKVAMALELGINLVSVFLIFIRLKYICFEIQIIKLYFEITDKDERQKLKQDLESLEEES